MTARKKDATAGADAAPAVVDLTAIADAIRRQDEGIDVPIMGPDGKTPLNLVIRIAGPDSERAQRAQEEQADELIERGVLTPVKSRERKQRGIRYLAKITLGWAPAIKVGDEEWTYSRATAEKVYAQFPFIRDQVDRAAVDRARFMSG